MREPTPGGKEVGSPSILVATRVKQGLLSAYRGNAFAIKIPMDFVSALCGPQLLQVTATELPASSSRPAAFLQRRRHSFASWRNQAFHESQRAAAPQQQK